MSQTNQNVFAKMIESEGLEKAVAHFASLYDDAKVTVAIGQQKVQACQFFRADLGLLSEQSKSAESVFVYGILADVCGLQLEEVSGHLKYAPRAVFSDWCSLRIEEISAPIATLLDAISQKIQNPILRARVADVAYESTGHHAGPIRKERLARVLSAYCGQETYNRMNWRTHGETAWRRFVELCKTVGQFGESHLKNLIARLYEALQYLHSEDAIDVCGLIVDRDLDCAKNRELIFEKLLCAYNDASGESRYLVQDTAAKCMAKLEIACKNSDGEYKAYELCGDAWMNDGDAWAARNDCVVAASRYEVAERWYRKIPKNARVDVAEKLRHCIQGKREGYAWWANNLKKITVLSQDISKEVAAVEKYMTTDDLNMAMVRFAHICEFDITDFSNAATTYSANNVVGKICQATQLASNGRIEARTDGDAPSRIESDVFTNIWLSHSVQARILPAYSILRQYHFDRKYFRDMVTDSAVPKTRLESVALGLWLGFLGEWRAASAILIPQIESIVRHKLQSAGVEVLHGKANSPVENYTSLSKLLERPDASEILGAARHKELMLLFGVAPYLNWRNNIAHGLVDDVPIGSACLFDVYVWHLFLKYVMTSHPLAK